MAALPAVAKGVRIDHHWKQGTDANVQVRTFAQYAGTLSTADAVTWLANIVAAMGTYMTANMSNTCSLVLSELTDLSSSSAPQVLDSTGHTGGQTAAALPAGNAMVMRYHMSRRYRGGHPRVYLPGHTSGDLSTPSVWDPTSLANKTAAWITYLAAITSNTNPAAIGAITHINISYFQGFVNHTFPSGRVKAIPSLRATPVVDVITNVAGLATVASQRRRNETP